MKLINMHKRKINKCWKSINKACLYTHNNKADYNKNQMRQFLKIKALDRK